MFNFLKKLFERGRRKYVYKLNGDKSVYVKNHTPFCTVNEFGYLEPMNIPISKILSEPLLL
ncbi:hypothetical protein A35_0052 (plasmid) [Coxiella burnetii 'MSU Goat Q177']|nr:hypothetical protein A35_0052 [Coxiella burnetii 'MSU Goat Q177']